MSNGSFPNNDKQIALPSGRVIRFYELIVLRTPGEESFSVHYDTTIPAENHGGRTAEAGEVIHYFSSRATRSNATRANASICSTPAQVATDEFPEEIYMFDLGSDGSWEFAGMAELPPRPA